MQPCLPTNCRAAGRCRSCRCTPALCMAAGGVMIVALTCACPNLWSFIVEEEFKAVTSVQIQIRRESAPSCASSGAKAHSGTRLGCAADESRQVDQRSWQRRLNSGQILQWLPTYRQPFAEAMLCECCRVLRQFWGREAGMQPSALQSSWEVVAAWPAVQLRA
jgi:hypothetical protein